MTVTATPTVTVGGSPVAAATGAVLPGLVALDSLSVPWGRASPLDQPDPARAAFTVLDTTPGRTFARSQLVGQPVVLGWADGATSGVFFRGRITDAPARRYVSPDGKVSGVVVHIAASSKVADAANYVLPEGTVWPAESFNNRLARILTLLPSGLFPGWGTLQSRWTTYTAPAVDVSGADALSLLRKLYDSTARAMIYDPALDGLTYAPRHFIAAGAAGGDFQYSARLALDGGLWAATADPVPMGGSWLDATSLAYDGDAARSLEHMLTRVEVQWSDGTTTATQAAPVVQGLDEAALGRRTLSVDSWHSTAVGATDCLTEWTSIIVSEASAAVLDPVTYSTARTPFRDATVRGLLLAGCEQAQWWFIRGSWLPEVAASPVVAFSGGTIGYAGGEWSLALQPTATWNANLRPGLTAATAVHSGTTARIADCDPSLTVGDLGFIQLGAGF